MNHCVPEFDMDEFYSAPSSSGQSRQKNMTQEDDIMELVWHNGQPGVQNPNHRLFSKPSPPLKSQQRHQDEQYHNQPPSYPTAPPPLMPDNATTANLFMQEDEMTSWLHYPLDDVSSFDRNLNDLFYHPPGQSAAPPPPVPQPRHYHQTRPQSRPPPPPSASGFNFSHFARLKARVPESGQASLWNHDVLRESTVVDSSGTPTMGPNSSFLPDSRSVGGVGGTSTVGGSISGASATATADLMPQPPADDRKRKGKASADLSTDNQSEDLEIESFEAKKQCRGSGTTSSGKRSRASEVHNLSERRRRDRINEKMKALQELIPRCSKTDKASMLDEAIEYLKSLQMQLQMMSMGYYGMVPMMFPGVQQYMPMPPMGMGIGMDTRMNRPMVPFPVVLTGSHMAPPGAHSSLGPRFPFPNFPMHPPVQPFDPSSAQCNRMESVGNQNVPLGATNVGDSYQQFLGGQQMHAQQISQNPPISTHTTSNPSTSREAEENQSHPSGTG